MVSHKKQLTYCRVWTQAFYFVAVSLLVCYKQKYSWNNRIFGVTFNNLGPIVSGLSNQFGVRTVVMGGAIITSLCYVGCAFAPSIYYMMALYGVIGGNISNLTTYIDFFNNFQDLIFYRNINGLYLYCIADYHSRIFW